MNSLKICPRKLLDKYSSISKKFPHKKREASLILVFGFTTDFQSPPFQPAIPFSLAYFPISVSDIFFAVILFYHPIPLAIFISRFLGRYFSLPRRLRLLPPSRTETNNNRIPHYIQTLSYLFTAFFHPLCPPAGPPD